MKHRRGWSRRNCSVSRSLEEDGDILKSTQMMNRRKIGKAVLPAKMRKTRTRMYLPSSCTKRIRGVGKAK